MKEGTTRHIYRPGEDNVPAGNYHEVGPRGGHVKKARTAHIEAGHRLPPTSKHGNGWMKD